MELIQLRLVKKKQYCLFILFYFKIAAYKANLKYGNHIFVLFKKYIYIYLIYFYVNTQ